MTLMCPGDARDRPLGGPTSGSHPVTPPTLEGERALGAGGVPRRPAPQAGQGIGTGRKLCLLGSLYFAQGLPYGFFVQALPVLLRQQGLPLPAIGLANLLVLPWALKFLWAPLVDRHGSARLGRRRSWILPLQGLTVLALLGLALLRPQQHMGPVLVAVGLCNLLAATQDIATDALAVDLLEDRERGPGNGVQVAGYRVGMIIGGGLLLILFERLGWRGAFLTMAGLLLASSLPVLLHREPGQCPPAKRGGLAVGAALRAFVERPGARIWLLVLLVYKTGEALATGMLRPFLVDRGLGLGEMGWLLGTVGFALGLCGALLGGLCVGPLGRRRALLLFGIVQTLAVSGYAAAALGRPGALALYALCGLEHLASGLATVSLFTAMMDVSRPETGATDYTLQASVVVLATGGAAAASGFLANALGYAGHFLLCTGLCGVGTFCTLVWLPAWESLRRTHR